MSLKTMTIISSQTPSTPIASSMTWVLASSNPGKLREFQALLQPCGVELVAQSDHGIDPAEEPYGSFVENALMKARHASERSGMPALADDSGLVVDALGGLPGVFSARFAELCVQRGDVLEAELQGLTDQDARNNACLLRYVAKQGLLPAVGLQARFVCVVVFVRYPGDPSPLIAQGQWLGELTMQPRGQGGFGYDPLFLLPALQRTAAELSMTEKNAMSHRGQAIQHFLMLAMTSRLLHA